MISTGSGAPAARAVSLRIRSSWYTVNQLWSPSMSATSTAGNVGSTLWLTSRWKM